MFGLGTQELLILAVIVLLLFGNRLPSVMRSLGRGVVEFKKGLSGVEDEIEHVGRTPKAPQTPPTNPPSDASAHEAKQESSESGAGSNL